MMQRFWDKRKEPEKTTTLPYREMLKKKRVLLLLCPNRYDVIYLHNRSKLPIFTRQCAKELFAKCLVRSGG